MRPGGLQQNVEFFLSQDGFRTRVCRALMRAWCDSRMVPKCEVPGVPWRQQIDRSHSPCGDRARYSQIAMFSQDFITVVMSGFDGLTVNHFRRAGDQPKQGFSMQSVSLVWTSATRCFQTQRMFTCSGRCCPEFRSRRRIDALPSYDWSL